MEISDFKELFTYNHAVTQNYMDAFKQKLSWEDVIKNRETGWLSLKDTLLHIIWVEDSWKTHFTVWKTLIDHFLILTMTRGTQFMIITLVLH